jgi:multicomponent K+:H+ antiporter subunit A
MALILLALLPFLGAGGVVAVGRMGRGAVLVAALLPPAGALLLLLSLLPEQPLIVSWPWVPAFGLELAYRLDGLSFLFAFLILAIGLLILGYSIAYFGADRSLPRFLSLMLAFMGGMLGIVLAENLLLLVMFWEITSLTSFLLIAFEQREAAARRSALMALTVTGAGGLALLGGVVLLGTIAGFDVTDVLHARERIVADPLAVPILLLVVLAAFTKSAQLPLHFWLPNAMVAPTPVSAYLHSAALVKAGIYLLARLWPVLSEVEPWTPLVAGTGLATMLVGAWAALRQNDVKALLAYSTISHLGMIVMLLGLGSPLGVVAALFHVLNHTLFKAALFMVAGGIDHATGTRDLARLGGLWRVMPALSVTALVGIAAMAGVPPLGGYISKEMMLDAVVELPVAELEAALVRMLATTGALLSAAYGFAFAWRGFLAAPGHAARDAQEPAPGLTLPAGVLVAACLALGLFPEVLAGRVIESAAAAVTASAPPHADLALWHGLNLPFLLGLIALGGGLAVAVLRRRLAAAPRLLPEATLMFHRAYDGALATSREAFHGLHNRALHRYLAILIGAILIAGLLAGAPAWQRPGGILPAAGSPAPPVAAVGWAILVIAVIGTVWLCERRVSALILVSVAGLVLVLAYAQLSAPDLALTQVAVEIATTVLLLLAIRLLPEPEAASRPLVGRRLREIGLALGAGAGAGVVAFLVMSRPRHAIVAHDVLREATDISGRNLVHLVLVDFRAFDTLGEISVLMIAALGVFALVRGFLDQLAGELPWRRMILPEKAWDPYPLQLMIIARLLLPLAQLVAVFLFLRGATHPGGGFVAGLVVAMAILIQYMAHGVGWTEQRIVVSYRTSVACGVLIAALTGLGSLARGEPFLTHAHTALHLPVIGEVELGTVMLFDVGVLLTVAGATLLAIVNIGRIETRVPGAA